ncbi:flagellar basal body rod protein FlgB [Spongiibacter taiwanensis]|uniref:flagellar basal body rod protein FlgB n=1 Tax=Spongiibacter taiwanensis TaxID=1748242 RepID=UPI0020358652|nr:flagellar basal body rod protein FlgB [Spongiibacter taiwanensis]USA43785.1 flagellar basal body rod protein FlgB [Spongiibacter taiwanensis]
MAINFNKALGVHEQALYLRERRNEVLAGNIANAETPGYKARDIDFRAALGQAEGQLGMNLAVAKTRAGHMDLGPVNASANGVEAVDLKYRNPQQPSLDGNTVESHVEQAEFADNALRYQSTLQFLGSRFSSLKSIIQGGR